MAELRPSNMTDRIAAMQDFKLYRDLHWEGSFEEYLGIVREKPHVTGNAANNEDRFPSPMNEEPLRILPPEWRAKAIDELRLSNDKFKVRVEGDMDPASRFVFKYLMQKYEGDWAKMVHNHVRVRRLVLTEKDRVGIGTFQPKDEKNQDSTELTGDINYRKIAEYGSDSDPPAFNSTSAFTMSHPR